MLNQFLPRYADNTYKGYKLALWLFALVVLVKAAISVNCIANPRQVAGSADGIPLNTFPPAAVQTIVSDFATWGLAMLMLCVVCAVVLARYRTLVPLMFAVLLTEQLARKLLLYFMPVPTTGTHPGSTVSLVLLALMAIGLVLSLVNRESKRTASLRAKLPRLWPIVP